MYLEVLYNCIRATMKSKYAYKVAEIAKALSQEYKDFAHHNKRNPLDELIFIICSVKRREQVYLYSYKALKEKFPSYRKLLEAPTEQIAQVLTSAGLQNQKASMIKNVLSSITKEFGKPTLSPLNNMTDSECEKYLAGLSGIGKKVSRCVMLYSFDRQVFPVDSNCWRISQRLGWIKKTSLGSRQMDTLQSIIPPHLRFSLHVNMVSHGRSICKAQNPFCSNCMIIPYCKQLL